MWTVRTDKGDETMKESKTMPTKTFDEIRKAHDARIPKKADISEWKKFEEITKNERWVSVDVLRQWLENNAKIMYYQCEKCDFIDTDSEEEFKSMPKEHQRFLLLHREKCGGRFLPYKVVPLKEVLVGLEPEEAKPRKEAKVQ